jgi:ribonucleotide reductase beta subunit family protein with ferritin-like domain
VAERPLTSVADDADDDVDGEASDRPVSLGALYDHWERNQWAIRDIDLAGDAASYAALDERQQKELLWILSHRFHGEHSVGSLLAPFLDAAPSHEMRVLIATQIADEYRHLQAVLRIYEHVFGIKGFAAAKQAADARIDAASRFLLYDALERNVLPLRERRDEDTFLKAVLSYHVIGEGTVARAAQAIAAERYASYDQAFPGLVRLQHNVTRDEARHIGIGVCYTRLRMLADPQRTSSVIDETVAEFAEVSAHAVELAKREIVGLMQQAYGIDPDIFYAEVLRLLQVRLHSIGYIT